MRIRQIKPEFWKHDGIGELSMQARLLFIGLWAMADAKGRIDDKPKIIKAEVMPYDSFEASQIDVWLDEIANHYEKFITRYQVDGKQYIQINNFNTHQKLMGNESSGISKRPGPEIGTIRESREIVTTSNQNELLSNPHTDIRSTEYGVTDNGDTEDRINGEINKTTTTTTTAREETRLPQAETPPASRGRFFEIHTDTESLTEDEWIFRCLQEQRRSKGLKSESATNLKDFLSLFPSHRRTYERWLLQPMGHRIAAFVYTWHEARSVDNQLSYALNVLEEGLGWQKMQPYLETAMQAVEKGDFKVKLR